MPVEFRHALTRIKDVRFGANQLGLILALALTIIIGVDQLGSDGDGVGIASLKASALTHHAAAHLTDMAHQGGQSILVAAAIAILAAGSEQDHGMVMTRHGRFGQLMTSARLKAVGLVDTTHRTHRQRGQPHIGTTFA